MNAGYTSFAFILVTQSVITVTFSQIYHSIRPRLTFQNHTKSVNILLLGLEANLTMVPLPITFFSIRLSRCGQQFFIHLSQIISSVNIKQTPCVGAFFYSQKAYITHLKKEKLQQKHMLLNISHFLQCFIEKQNISVNIHFILLY